MRVPLIIDTDTAQDDCVALLVGLLDDAADLKAITMVAGNVGFDRQVQNAQMTLNAAGRLGSVPVFEGCRRPMVHPWVSAENVHGDGTGGLDMDFTGVGTHETHGVNALLRLADDHPGELTVAAIGPLTNIAMACVMDPSFPEKVKALYVMGGSNNARGNITAPAEFNIYVDPEAAKVVFDAGFDVTVIPWAPLTLNDAVFSRAQLAQIKEIGTPLSEFFLRVCGSTLEFDESVGIPGTTHPDSLTVAVALHHDLATGVGEYNIDVDITSPLTKGYTAMSWGVHGLEPNAHVIEAADGERFFAMICDLLATPINPTRPFTN